MCVLKAATRWLPRIKSR